jgi:hypothetical protein
MEKFNAMRTRLSQHLQTKAIRLKGFIMLTCLLLGSISAFAQTKTVTGTVTDAANEPLIGASVLVQGTSTGTITDMDGKYSISVTPEDVLVFSYVGMTTQSIKVGTQSIINVTLKEDSQVLAETVVIGYGSAKKRDLTGSITNVKGEEIANKPAMNPLSSLQGKVAGEPEPIRKSVSVVQTPSMDINRCTLSTVYSMIISTSLIRKISSRWRF